MVISHELSTTGAPIALLEAVHQLRNLGYYITVASPDDGDMREAFLSYCDQIVIDEKLRTSKLSEIEWTSVYNLVFVNTVKLFYLLRSLRSTPPRCSGGFMNRNASIQVWTVGALRK